VDSEGFVEALKRHVRDAAIEDTLANLKTPPGRKVSLQERMQSDWYNSLSVEEANYVRDIVSRGVQDALFGFLAVLDGVRTIDDNGGVFELIYVADQRCVLNDPRNIGLHDLLNASN